MDTDQTTTIPESRIVDRGDTAPLLLQLRSDRRLGHEWDDWDGSALQNDGVFTERPSAFFLVLAGLLGVVSVAGAGLLWLVGPRLASLWAPLPGVLGAGMALFVVAGAAWLFAVGVALRRNTNWLPPRLAERGLLPAVMPLATRLGQRFGSSRDRVGNAAMQVFNRLSAARSRGSFSPEELLILVPRCLGKEAMRAAMDVSTRYGVPLFVASRGRYARQMIGMRRPKAILAIACERDLVSGIHDVAKRLPVFGTTLAMGDGPCKNTTFSIDEVEDRIRSFLGIGASVQPGS